MRPGFFHRSLRMSLLLFVLGFYPGLTACGSGENGGTEGGSSKTLSWTAVPDSSVLAYKVYWGTMSQQYDSNVDVGPNVSYTVSGLQRGTTYFFAVSAYNSSGESALSAEVSSIAQ